MSANILFIDDDRAGREVALFNLRKAGYEVTAAPDGEEGLELFSSAKFDLVVTEMSRRQWRR
jgi:two-component system chemotaxis response regulator CheY